MAISTASSIAASTSNMSARTLFQQLTSDLTSLETRSWLLEAARNISLTPAKRGQIIAALWAARERETLSKLLERPEFCEPAALARAMQLLDIPRKLRQLQRKLQLTREGSRKNRVLRAQLNDLQAEDVPGHFSFSRSFGALLRSLLARIPASRLEFDLLFYEKGPWKDFCNLSHCKPDMWTLSYFQTNTFGGDPPEGSFLADARQLTTSNLPELLSKHPQLAECFSYIRVKVPNLDEDCKRALARCIPLADILWHYEQFGAVADDTITARLTAGESLAGAASTDNFAKLLDRLLTFRKKRTPFWQLLMPHAEALLDELKNRRLALVSRGGPRSLQSLAAAAVVESGTSAVPEAVAMSVPVETQLRVAVLGDASASMQVCVDSACICGAMMSAIFDAQLVFFGRDAFRAKCHEMPTTVQQVLEVTEEVRANSSTSPAAALYEFYRECREIDIFVVVTDEEENTRHDGSHGWGRQLHQDASDGGGMFFAQLFEKYRADVHEDTELLFVSFLSNPTDEGAMVRALKERGITAKQFKYDQQRPDLSKFDTLLGMVLLQASQSLAQQRTKEQAARAA